MSSSLVESLRARARELGFCLLRVTSAAVFEREREALLGRIEAGLLAEMRWIDAERARVSTDPGALVPGARSVISVAMPYGRPGHAWRGGPRGRIARYAWARDYHVVMKERMRELREFLLAEAGAHGEQVAVVVDTGRVVDRAVAVRSGLGWYGKNAMVLSPTFGSWLMLGELVTTVPLPVDEPLRKSCGRCTRCLDRCPTGAIVAPGVIDSRRCISYLTIEHRGPIPHRLRALIGAWIFGCDVCQEVCPVNDAAERVPGTRSRVGRGLGPLEPVLDPEPELEPLLRLTRDEWRRRYHHTPVGRAGYAGFLRNVCVALGNVGDASAVPALAEALAHPEPLVRAHAAWALGRIGTPAGRSALAHRRSEEPEPDVLAEIDAALSGSELCRP
ncbi:MAG TPA: tRNA epoxyqueuosine(34) reductase QueG [Chloroflexota bacterium]|jgi:epoxyqueuosine reductase|nr:tRNA epoxyqueuosine(34) reductase QueG [Chloroflexota bacterium]